MHKQSFFIDKVTNSIELVSTGKSFDTEVIKVLPADLKSIPKKNAWRFNWKAEFKQQDRHLFKLVVTGDHTIQGLISLQAVENYIEMHLIETAPHNYGKSKQYLGVPANLVAFACKLSFDFDFGGYVAFTAKTALISHYINTLGAELIFKDRMVIHGNSAKKLVNSYYKNDLDDR